MKNNTFKAPQNQLRSSWSDVPFTKAKVPPTLLKYSLSNNNRSSLLTKRGTTVTNSTFMSGNQY
jgi:hypothetical protein